MAAMIPLLAWVPDVSRFTRIAVGMGWGMHIAGFLLVSYHCLSSGRDTAARILWIFVSWSFPVIGPMLYLSFGINRLPAKGWHKQVHDEKFLEERRVREAETFPLAYWRSMYGNVASEPYCDFGRKLDRAMDSILPSFPLLGGNDLRILIDGNEAIPAMLKAIESAESHVHVQSFIVRNDHVGHEFLDLLAKKARSGITVRFMYDRFGSTHAIITRLFRKYRDIPNMKIVGWTQANPLKRQFQVNLRNHRKIIVVDGKIAFCGGMNVQDQSEGRGTMMVRDYHFAVQGPAVLELQYTFMRDWNFMTDEGPEELLREIYFPREPVAGDSLVRIVNSGPTAEMEAIRDVLFFAISGAEKEILLVTPYFVPTREILKAIRAAALRGVDVRIVVPGRTNHICAGLAGQALYDGLLDAGVRIFRRAPPFMHAKAYVVDGKFALVGTANLDIRSLRLNYETNLAVHGEEFANRLREVILGEIAASEEVNLTAWQRRSKSQQLVENIAGLFMPVL